VTSTCDFVAGGAATPVDARNVLLALVGPQAEEITTLEDQLLKARQMLRRRQDEEQEEVRRAFNDRWAQLPSTFLDDGYVTTGFPRLHSETYTAEAARLLRLVAPLTDYTDCRTGHIVSDLTQRMSAARHNRGSVTLTELRDAILSQALPLEAVAIPHAYVRTRYGYVTSPLLEKALEQERQDVRVAMRQAMKRYRRATRVHRFRAVAAGGPVRCIVCNGPLMANFYGFSRRGIACAHCGFSPFVSLLYACTCGRPILLVAQPPTELVEIARAIREALDSAVCEHCSQSPRPERMQTRVFQLNIPWPPENFSDSRLIEARKELGWKGDGRFRNGTVRALDVLLTEALEERETRLEHGGCPSV
jgi:hypothetical protein